MATITDPVTHNAGTDPSIRISLEVDNESTLPMLLEGRRDWDMIWFNRNIKRSPKSLTYPFISGGDCLEIGLTVAVLGHPLENHTAESWIPRRQLRAHDQLMRARRLRASLEYAADLASSLPLSPSSFPEALHILQSSLPDIHQLVRLTEALRGNYLLEDAEYEEWDEWARSRNEMEDKEQKREERMMRQQLRELWKEFRPEIEIDEELESRHDALTWITKSKDNTDDKKDDSDMRLKKVVRDVDHAQETLSVGKTGSAKARSPIAESNIATQEVEDKVLEEFDQSPETRESTESDEDFEPTERITRKRADREKSHGTTTTSSSKQNKKRAQSIASAERSIDLTGTATERNTSKKAKIDKLDKGGENASATDTCSKPIESSSDEKHQSKKSSTETSSRSAAAAASASQATVNSTGNLSASQSTNTHGNTTSERPKKSSNSLSKAPKSRPPKKCHFCKVSTTRYRHCNYWFVSGHKCGKAFCSTCLTTKYSLGDDVLSPSNLDGIPSATVLSSSDYDKDWHCPSCLGTCECKACVRQRKKDEERERRALEAAMNADSLRKSSRRSVAHSGYYGFL